MLRYNKIVSAIISNMFKKKENEPYPVSPIIVQIVGSTLTYWVNNANIVESERNDRTSKTPIKKVSPSIKLDFVLLYESA